MKDDSRNPLPHPCGAVRNVCCDVSAPRLSSVFKPSAAPLLPASKPVGYRIGSSRKLSALLPPPQRVPLAFIGQAVTNRIANAPYVFDLGLERPAVLACSNFILL